MPLYNLFPLSILKEKVNDKRISISGDIVCVAKDSKLLENIMPPLENWDKI